MRKGIIVIAIGISIMVAGGVVTALEFASLKPYDVQENVANFPSESFSTQFSFEEVGTEYLEVFNSTWIDFDFDDYIDGDYDYLEGDYDDSFNFRRQDDVIINEDENQKEGTVTIDYYYLSPFDSRRCALDSISYAKDSSSEYRSHTNTRDRASTSQRSTSRSSRRGQHRNRIMFSEDDTTYLFPQCYDRGWGLGYSNGQWLGIPEEFKLLMKHKQMPVNLSEITVTVNPKDSYRIKNR